MFKTDDKVVQICLAISYTILAMYAFINFFNPAYIIDQYPSLESNDTTIFFLIWYGMMNSIIKILIFQAGHSTLAQEHLHSKNTV